MGDVVIDGPGGPIPAYLAVPPGEPPWPGVVVVHDALGMTTDLRQQAGWLAAAGSGQVFDDLEAARSAVARRPDATGAVGVIGFCLGGGIALVLATRPGYSASSVNYGGLPRDAETALARACPVVAGYGARDRTLGKAPHTLKRILTAHRVPHDVTVYPDAGHGFLNNHPPGETPRWAVIAGAVARTGYHEPSAVDARRRIVTFFDTHLRQVPGAAQSPSPQPPSRTTHHELPRWIDHTRPGRSGW